MNLCAAFASRDRILQPRRRILSGCLFPPDAVSTALGGQKGAAPGVPTAGLLLGSSEAVTERGRGEGRRERSPTSISGLRGGSKKEKWGRMEAISPV